MKDRWFIKIRMLLLVAAAGTALVFSGSASVLTYAQDEDEDAGEAEEVPEGFKAADFPAMPSAEDVEAGKRVDLTKCVWCHGVEGAGDGPAADRLWPRPRNFNQGTFKIRHTASGELPLPDADLLQTVTHGLPGSAMPSWDGILTEEQRRQAIAFVTTELVQDREFDDKEFETYTVLQLDDMEPIPPTEESVKRGAELFESNKCFECHGVKGRGDGNAFNLKDDWGFPIQPADQTKCWNFRGSRRDPYDVKNIFRTFSTGVNGTPMPSFADNTTIEERWHLSNFVQSLCERGPDGEPLPIDPLTDKPKIKFVVLSGPIEGEIPGDPNHELWQNRERRLVALGGQITHKPRNFVNRIDDVWVRSLYNDKEIAFMFQWNDRSQSIATEEQEWDPTEVNLEDYGLVSEQRPTTGEPGSIAAAQNKYRVFNDALAIQFPVKWQEIPPPEKPRFFWGNEKYPVDIVKWEADGSLRAFTGLGWDQDFEDRDIFAMDLTLLNAGWEDGRWTLMFKRPIKEDYEEDTYFEVGKYIPTVFFVWDGHNGDVGRKLAVSAFYYTVLIPPIPVQTYIYPTAIAVGIVFLEGWVLTRRANKRKGKA